MNETDLINIIQDDILSDFDIQQKQNEYLKAWERVSNQCSINGIDSINEHKVRIQVKCTLFYTFQSNMSPPIVVLDFHIEQLYFSWEIKIVIWWKIVSSILMQNWKIWLQVIKDILFQIVVSEMKWDKKLKKWSSHIIQARFLINDFWVARKWSDSIGRYIDVTDQSELIWKRIKVFRKTFIKKEFTTKEPFYLSLAIYPYFIFR